MFDFDLTPGCGSAEQRLREQDQDGIDGNWDSNPCNTTGRISGYCQVEASQYSLSGSDAKVFFYGEVTEPNRTAAEAACNAAAGRWFGPT